MINCKKYIISLIGILLFSECGSYDKKVSDFTNEKIVISYGYGPNKKFAFNSSSDKVVCIGFLDSFNDTIVTIVNNKEEIVLNRKDSISYKKLKNEDIFKFILVKNKRSKITVLLKTSKKKTSFDLVENKKMYLLNHFNDVWFLTIWD